MTWILFCRDLKASFRGSFLGYVWLFLPPIATTLVWIVLNKSNVVSFEDPNIPYPLFVLVGTVIWSAFTRAAMLPLQTFQASKAVFSKIKVPVGAFLLVAPLRAFFDSLLYLLTAALLIPFFEISVTPALLLLPAILLITIFLGFALSLLLLPVSALYSDVQQALVLIFSVAIYLAPVVYPVPKDGLFASFVACNPLTSLIISARECLFVGVPAAWPVLLLIGLVSCIFIMISFAGMRIAMPHLTARMGM
jgi:lipopolysaccharide transport system permease protein